jgi:LuxR family transcriptional regulator, maltose regulon positive regulatory protein
MTEPRTLAPEVSAQDALLATKLRTPRPRTGWVPRPRLVQRLRAGIERELVLVCGPAGFGKSSLLADWVRADPRAIAWLSLDAADNDPVRFWRHVAAALDEVRPGVAEQVAPLVNAATSTSFAAAVTVLVNELAAAPDQVALVLDDYHLIDAPEVHRSLEFLLDHLPASLHLVLASRSDPPLPLARLRARGQLTELRADELRFTAAETAELMRVTVGRDLPRTVVAALGERTEGWAAGLQLAALSLQGRSDVTGFVEEFSGSHRFVLDYLTEEVLERQSEELRTFLLETSILQRLSGSLCDAVVGCVNSQQTLESMERASLFLIPLDAERRWWRYHHLFADLLRANLQRQHPERVPELHRAAASWYERNELPADAIRHALAAGEASWAAQLVEKHLEEQIRRRGEVATLVSWLAALPPETIRRRPALALGQAKVTVMAGRLDEVEPLLTMAEQAFDQAPDEPYRASIDRNHSLLANVPAAIAIARADLARLRGDADRERLFAHAALTQLTEHDDLLGAVAHYHVAFADWIAGRLVPAERALAEIFAERAASPRRDLALRAAFDLGGVQQAQGRLGAAERTYQRGLEVARSTGSPPTIGMAYVGLAEVGYERDELPTAAQHATRAVEQCRRHAYALALVAGLVTLARIRQAEGDPVGALAAVDEAEAAMPQALVDLRYPVSALRARLMLAAGNTAEAARWLRGRGLTVHDEPCYPREPEYGVLARLLMAEHKPAAALELLGRWRTLAIAQGRVGSVLRFRVLTALAHDLAGDQPAALAALTDALVLAAPERYLRVFLDDGAPIAALLRELLVGRRLQHFSGGSVAPEFLARLTAAFELHGMPVLSPARHGAVAVPGMVQPVSAREHEVLTLLAAGHPNREIAEKLFITVDTVKRHISHLFDKLGVSNRTQAVARARDLGLLG